MWVVMCIGCGENFKILTDLEDIEGCTFNCSHCGLLLVMEDGLIKDFHGMLHDDMPEWPADGTGTGIIEL